MKNENELKVNKLLKHRLVCGVGYNDGKYRVKIKGKNTKEYDLWSKMIYRCYYDKTHEVNKRYKDCTISENFKSYSYFYEWCQNQIGFNKKGFELDKDLCFKWNKIYSEDTCFFIPKELNICLSGCTKTKGDYPTGVSKRKSGRYVAHAMINGKSKSISYHDSIEDAFYAYKKEKEAEIKRLAVKYKDEIDERIFNSIYNYSIEIDD